MASTTLPCLASTHSQRKPSKRRSQPPDEVARMDGNELDHYRNSEQAIGMGQEIWKTENEGLEGSTPRFPKYGD